MLSFIINLDRSPERMARMTALMEKWHLPYERLEAVDGKTLTQAELEKLQAPYSARRYFLKDMTAGEIGVYLSQLEAWKRLAQSNEDWALIMEDDIEFASDPHPYLDSLDWIPEGVKIIQLAKEFAEPKKVVREPETHQLPMGSRLLVLLAGIEGGCMAYLIHRDVAAKLVEMSEKILAPCDDILFSHATPLRAFFKPWSLSPALVISNDQGVTYVGRDKGRIKTSFWRGPLQYIERKRINLHNSRLVRKIGVADVR